MLRALSVLVARKFRNPAPSYSEQEARGFWAFSLSPAETAALFATYAGWMLDGMDVMIFSFVLPSLITVWHISTAQAGLLGTSALLTSSVGGWLAGLAADRYGRVKVLQITILWFALFTFLSGFTNSFEQLFFVRLLQGFGFGGEWAVGSVLMGETIRAQHRGKTVGLVQSGWAVGWGLAALFYTICFSFLPQALAWRVMFWIGLIPALLVFYVRRRVREPAVFRKNGPRAAVGGKSWLHIFAPELLSITVLASLVALGAQGGYYAVTTWLPLYLKTSRGLSILNTGGYLCVVILGSLIGYLVGAYLTDALGRKKTLLLFALFSAVTVWLYTILHISNGLMLFLGFPLGFFASGTFSPMGAFFSELFPTRVRGSGQGFAYNLGRGAGALFPSLVGYVGNRVPLGHAIAYFAVTAYLIMMCAVLGLPETRGRELRD